MAMAGLVGLVAAASLAFFRFPTLDPAVLPDVASAVGIRPAEHYLGGLVRGLYDLVLMALPDGRAFGAMQALGWLTGGITTACAYCVLWNFCGGWIRVLGASARGRAIGVAVIATAALAFTASDPVWYGSQCLSASGLQIMLTSAAVLLTQLFARTLRPYFACLAMAVWAVVTADTPVGLFGVLALLVTLYFVERRAGNDILIERLRNPLVRMMIRRFLVFVFAGLFAATLLGEIAYFHDFVGIESAELVKPLGDRLIDYLGEAYRSLRTVAGWKTWAMAWLLVIAPLLAARLLRERTMADDRFVPLSSICVYLFVGAVSFSQLCGFRCCWFGNFFVREGVHSPLVWAIIVFMAAQTFLWSMMVLYSSLLLNSPFSVVRYAAGGDDAAAMPAGKRALMSLEYVRKLSIPAAVLLPLALLASLGWLRRETTLRGMLSLIDDYVRTVVDESAGADRVFTDGFHDAAVELEAFRRGETRIAVSMMSGNSPREQALRIRGLMSEDDLKSAQFGAAYLLRTWVEEKPWQLTNVVVQLGGELWRRRGSERTPVPLSTLAQTPEHAAAHPADAAAAAERGRALAERVLALYAEGDPDDAGLALHREAFRYAQWRIARLCQQRAERAGSRTWGAEARCEQRLADELCVKNHSYREMKRLLDRSTEARGSLLTPREGLKLCLDRADFRKAAYFAQSIIAGDPDDPHANFAIGMNYFLSEDYGRAEPYLLRCRASRPDDPAVLNNLAVAELRLYRFEEAERYAREALERLPDSPQIRRTLEAILEARKPTEKQAEAE